jgi:hypothetical protein
LVTAPDSGGTEQMCVADGGAAGLAGGDIVGFSHLAQAGVVLVKGWSMSARGNGDHRPGCRLWRGRTGRALIAAGT